MMLKSINHALAAVGIGVMLSSCAASGNTSLTASSNLSADGAARRAVTPLTLYFSNLTTYTNVYMYNHTANQCPWTLFFDYMASGPPIHLGVGDAYGPYSLQYDANCSPSNPGAWEVSYGLDYSSGDFPTATICYLDVTYHSGYLSMSVSNGTDTTCKVESGTEGSTFYYDGTSALHRRPAR